MEERVEVDTAFGPIWFHGRDTGRPVMLLLTGAFAAADVLDHTQAFLPDVDVWRAHLPGNHCPAIAPVSIGVFAAAYGEALTARVGERPLAVVGLSTGALVALALRTPSLKALLLVEPPLRSEHLWPMLDFRTQGPPGWETLIEPVFGIGPAAVRPVDYLATLDALTVPALALVGEAPLLPPRPTPFLPSFVDEESRARLAAHPRVRMEVVPGAGHNIPAQAPELFLGAMRRLCRAAAA